MRTSRFDLKHVGPSGATNGQVATFNDSTNKWEPQARVLTTKSGIVASGSFAGNPKKATVTFATAFPNALYSVVITAVDAAGATTYSPNVQSQVAGSFVITMGTNNISNLTQVNWIAVANGEST